MQTVTNMGVRNITHADLQYYREWIIDPVDVGDSGHTSGGRGVLDGGLTDADQFFLNGTFEETYLYVAGWGSLAVGESVDVWFRVDLHDIPALLADRMVQRHSVRINCVGDPTVLPNGTVLPPVPRYHLENELSYAYIAMIEQPSGNVTDGPPPAGETEVHIDELNVVGNVLNVSGSVDGFDTALPVFISIFDSSGARLLVEKVQLSIDGTFSTQVIIPSRWGDGVYTVHVIHGQDEGGATFVLPPAPPIASVPIVVEVAGLDPTEPVNVTGVGAAANLSIDVGGLTGSMLDGTASSTVTFPPSETTVVASFAAVSFPPSVTATQVPADGLLAMRISADVPDGDRVQGALGYEGSGRVTLQRVVEVGTGEGRVAFDMPVRIFLEGQAGGRAFYIDGGAGGAIVPIDKACAADDVGRVHAQLGGTGECQADSADGGKVIYTYHLTLFGTALPEHAAPLPTIHTCAVGIGAADLDMRAAPGRYSEPVRQAITNRGTLAFERVDLVATPWRIGYDGGPRAGADPPPPMPSAAVSGVNGATASSVLVTRIVQSLPADVTEVLDVDAGGGAGDYTVVAEGTAVARGLGGGDVAPLLFRLNLTPHGGLQGGTMAQSITYQATCSPP